MAVKRIVIPGLFLMKAFRQNEVLLSK
jgi:hypothetical protein